MNPQPVDSPRLHHRPATSRLILKPFALAAAFLVCMPVGLVRADNPTAEQLAFFENKVRPILSKRCYSCHSQSAKKSKGGLTLDRGEAVLAGGDSGPAVVPGKPAACLLIKAVKYDGLEMPPTGKLPVDEVATLTKWVEMGAPWPAANVKPVVDAEVGVLTPERLKHWAFQPLKGIDPPAATEADRKRHPSDRFVFASLTAKGLKPAPPADRRTLIRRASLDLIGLPPTPEEVEAFVADDSADTYAKLIDKRLASPHYGERWGRHWLDVARHSDGYGSFLDPAPLPEAWRYRDWVVKAFNDDLPYDKFVKYQIAGDLTGDGWEAATATGFLAVGPTYISDGGDPDSVAKAKAETLDDRVDTVTRGFLALTVSCARCHDHMFDPIPQADYYSLAAVFNNTKTVDRSSASPEVLARAEAHTKALDAANSAFRGWLAKADEEATRRLMGEAGRYLDALVAFHRLPEPRDLTKFAQQEKLYAFSLRAWTDALKAPKAAEAFPDLNAWLAAGPFDAKGETPEKLSALRKDFQTRLDKTLGMLRPPEPRSPQNIRHLAPEEHQLYTTLRGGPCRPNLEEQLPEADRTRRKELEAEVARLKATAPPALPRHVLQPADALLLFDQDGRGVDRPLAGIRALERLPGPELDSRKAERSAVGRHHQAGVQQHSAGSVGGVPPLDVRQVADPVGGVASEAELGRIVQHQDGAGDRGEASCGGCDVSGQDDAVVDAGIVTEPVRGLRPRPVLTRHRQRSAYPLPQVAEQSPQSRLQTLVGEGAARQLVFDPGVHARSPDHAPEAENHRGDNTPNDRTRRREVVGN